MQIENKRLKVNFNKAMMQFLFKNNFGITTGDKWLIFGMQLRINPLHKITEGIIDIYFGLWLIKNILRTKVAIKNLFCNFEEKTIERLHTKK